MSILSNHFKKTDWLMILPVLFLNIIGLVSIYSSSIRGGNFVNFKKQIIFLVLGYLLFFIFSFLDWRAVRDNSYLILIIYVFCILALLGLFFFAPVVRGVRAWYKFGSFSVDPIEATKIALAVLLAKYFSMRHVEMYRLKHILLSGFYVFIPCILIILQPNIGSALVIVFLWIGILTVSGIRLRHFMILCICGLCLLAIAWFYILKDYQKQRIIAFVAPQVEPLGSGWNQNQARIAIGSGGIWGQGFGNGSQTRYGFLPEPHNDFIFAAIAEEFGILGISVVIFLYVLFLWRIMKIAFKSKVNFCRLFAVGFSIMLMAQAVIHIAMNLGIIPVIGLSLPLVSYGGSNFLAIFAGLGFLQEMRE